MVSHLNSAFLDSTFIFGTAVQTLPEEVASSVSAGVMLGFLTTCNKMSHIKIISYSVRHITISL